MVPKLSSVQDRVHSLFYNYGLFCATHQLGTMVFTILSVLLVCYPLTNIPFLGNAPSIYKTAVDGFAVPSDGVYSLASPRWFREEPIGYIQQILVKTTIAPRNERKLAKERLVFRPTDTFRAPLHTAFKVVKDITDFQLRNSSSSVSLADLCLRVYETSVKESRQLPQYDCLVLSPANLWMNQQEVFLSDNEIVKTIYGAGRSTFEAAPRLRDIVFGVPWQETGVSKYFTRNRRPTLQYAVTIVYKTYNPKFIKALTQRLHELYPLSVVNEDAGPAFISHLSYRESSTPYLVEYTGLMAAYLVLFLYIYFSVQKIEMVKSKWGLAFAAVATVVMSLLMSISICAQFGVTPSVSSGELFPYLVVIIGLENVLVLTRSVVSTPPNMEVKFRIAEGLKKEGWKITKHLIAELTILLFGFFTFVPVIQEFCLFAFIGLLVDFYLQMVFFATVLSIDIRRLELSDLDKGSYVHVQSKRQRVLSISSQQQESVNDATSDDTFLVSSFFHIPKRIKVMNFVAQFRVVQRMIMGCTVIWISVVMYKTGILSSIVASVTLYEDSTKPVYFNFNTSDSKLPESVREVLNTEYLQSSVASILYQEPMIEMWKKLSFMHWPGVFSIYNKDIVGNYISFLPSVKLSIFISPSEAADFHMSGGYDEDMLDEGDSDYQYDGTADVFSSFQVFNNTRLAKLSSSEKVLFGLAGTSVVVVLIYFMSFLYGIMCGRNYHKWRTRSKHRKSQTKFLHYLKDPEYMFLQGHEHTIECLVTSGSLVVSCCLSGDIFVWDGVSGEKLTVIRRQTHALTNADDDSKIRKQSEQSSLLRSHASTPSLSNQIENFDLSPFVNTQFYKMEKRSFSECLQDIDREREMHTSLASLSSYRDSSISSLYEETNSRLGDEGDWANASDSTVFPDPQFRSGRFSSPNIWCLALCDGLIAAGCSDGTVELWDSVQGRIKCVHRSIYAANGVTSIKYDGNRVVAGRADGYVDFIEVCILPVSNVNSGAGVPLKVKGHRRVPSRHEKRIWSEVNIQCNLLQSVKAHQSAVTHLDVCAGRCLTASNDTNIVKVYKLDNASCLYTLHGHEASITSLHVDQSSPHIALSASEDGRIFLWDLITGACIHKLSGLQSPVLSLQCSNNYIAASGADTTLCIWDKSNGRLLHTIQRSGQSQSPALAVLAGALLVSGGTEALHFWDISTGELIQSSPIEASSPTDCVSCVNVINCTTVLASVGNCIHALRFPRVTSQKNE